MLLSRALILRCLFAVLGCVGMVQA